MGLYMSLYIYYKTISWYKLHPYKYFTLILRSVMYSRSACVMSLVAGRTSLNIFPCCSFLGLSLSVFMALGFVRGKERERERERERKGYEPVALHAAIH